MGHRRRHLRRRGRGAVAAGLVAVAAVGLTGCGGGVERSEAARAADAFTRAASDDPAAGCLRLAPRALDHVEEDGPCATVLAAAGLPTAGERVAVTVAGHSAQVRYTGDTLFLALFDDGWRVTAAGCRHTAADPAVPYECIVDGG